MQCLNKLPRQNKEHLHKCVCTSLYVSVCVCVCLCVRMCNPECAFAPTLLCPRAQPAPCAWSDASLSSPRNAHSSSPSDPTLNCRLVTLVLVALVTWLWRELRRPWGMPPGLPLVPVLGSLPFLSFDPGSYLDDISKNHRKYGPMFSMRAGK